VRTIILVRTQRPENRDPNEMAAIRVFEELEIHASPRYRHFQSIYGDNSVVPLESGDVSRAVWYDIMDYVVDEHVNSEYTSVAVSVDVETQKHRAFFLFHLAIVRPVGSTKKDGPMPKHPQICNYCALDMRHNACSIDWEQVWLAREIRKRREKLGRELTAHEYQDLPTVSDPCDNCCCGACGQRKAFPGQAHC